MTILLKNRILAILFLIVLIAGFFRFWQLPDYPVSLTIDEVAVGYNAYSILKTARDEHGEFLPLAFLSIGDYKPPFQIYLAVPTVAFFGLNELGVRFSMALISTLSVITIFLLIRQIVKNESVALLSSFLMAISPWHIHLARFSYEVTLGLFLVILGMWLFLKALDNKGKLLWLSAVCFVLSIYSYHVERIFTPILILGLVFIFRERLVKYKTAIIKSLIIGGLLLIPFVQIMLGPAGQARARSVFINKDPVLQSDLKQQKESQNLIQYSFDNNFLIITNQWAKKYLNYFDPKFLFFSGMQFTLPGRPDVGLFYLFELPFILYGSWVFFGRKKFRFHNLILFWILVGPLVASFTIEEQHFSRSLVLLPPLQLLTAIGIWSLWEKLKERNYLLRISGILIGFVILSLSVCYYMVIYYINYPIQLSEYWQYGWKEAAIYAWQNKDKYREIVVDPKFGSETYLIGTPPAYFLFYGKYDPALYQKSPRRIDQLSTNFENFTFRPIFWKDDKERADTLYIGSPWVLPRQDIAESQIKKVIKFKNGIDGLLIVESTGSAKFQLN